MAKFKPGDFVEDISKGDVPFLVTAIERDSEPPVPSRYTIEDINGVPYSNYPEYLLVPARPVEQSQFGFKGKFGDK